MPQKIRSTLLSFRDLLVSVGPFLVLALILLSLTFWWLNPTPPKTVTLMTGSENSAYEAFGKRYAKLLAKEGITVKLIPSEGSLANLQALASGKADIAFVQGGGAEVTEDGTDHDNAQKLRESGDILSLGSLFVEPVWFFYREAAAHKSKTATLSQLTELQGLRVNVGTPGSGVPNLVNRLLTANHIDLKSIIRSELEQTPATMAFLNGDIDVNVLASAPEATMVQMLLQTPGVKLMDFAQNEAYSRKFEFLTPVTLPRGVVDLAQNIPPNDVHLIASTTSLLARKETHPALLQLFAQAAQEIHGTAGWFNRAKDFPNAKHTEYPLAAEAERQMKTGTPLLQRWLRFWLANVIERMWFALGIIIAILLPISKVVPPLYNFRIRSRVFRWYAQLRDIEERSNAIKNPSTHAALISELDDLEKKTQDIVVPLTYADELYSLKSSIHLVRTRLMDAAAK